MSISKGRNFITRKFSLRPQVKNIKEELKIIDALRRQFIKFRNLENEFIEHAISELRKNHSLINQFRSDSQTAYKGDFYDYFRFNLYKPKTYRNVEFKERVKRCASFYPYYALRNWIIKNENLKIIIDDLVRVLSNQKYMKHAFISFMIKGTLGEAYLKIMNSHLRTDVFGNPQSFSYEFLKNNIAHLRNLLVSRCGLETILNHRLNNLMSDSLLLERFSHLILNGFTRKYKKKDILIRPNDLAEYFLDLFIRIVKSKTTTLARRKLHSDKKLLKGGTSVLVKLVNSNEFETIEQFKQHRDENIFDGLQKSLENWVYIYNKDYLSDKIKELVEEYLKELSNPNRNLTKSAFNPVFSRVHIKSLDRAGFEAFYSQKLKHKIKEDFKNIFLTKEVALETIKQLIHIRDNIYKIVPIPKMKKLTLPIVSCEQIYDLWDNDLSAHLKLIKRKPSNKLFISAQKELTKSKIEVEREKRFIEINKIYDKVPPTLKMEGGRKIVLCQPFYTIKGDKNLSESDQTDKKIVMGVDLGLKHFAVLSVRDESIKKEIARYFLGQRMLFDMKFNDSSGKFAFHNIFKKNHPTNIKWKLIYLRNKVRELQSKKNEYENKFPNKRIHHTSKSLSCCWDKINNIHSEIINQLTHKIVKIAQYHGVSTIKFENLKWAKHSKRIDVGQFLAWNQVHWFYSQVQWHIAQMAARKWIEVVFVDARDTSKICSECHLLRPDYTDKVGATRKGKQFICTHPLHARLQLDADLNAARNIAISVPI